MGHFYKKEIQEKREDNLFKDAPTPAKTSKKIDKPFVIQRRFIGKLNDKYAFASWDTYDGKWHKVSSFKKEVSAKQALKAEISKEWHPKGAWDYRIINLHETNE